MPRFPDLPDDFSCPYRGGCPYLEGRPAGWVLQRFQQAAVLEERAQAEVEPLRQSLQQERRRCQNLELENQRLQAQLHALHRRQFKGRKAPRAARPQEPSAPPKKRGAPLGHPPWQRPPPTQIDRILTVAAPTCCPHCQSADLQPVAQVQKHTQEDILLAPRTVATSYVHRQAYCPQCDRHVLQPGPGELLGSYIGPVAKAAAVYLRHELNVSERKVSRFFADFFGLRFVPASAYGFERQAVRCGRPLYEDLRQKIRALPVAHADETGWRHDGQNHWVWYGGDDDLAFFQLDPHRSTAAAQALWGARFAGVMVADAFASYHGVCPKDWQSCLAHIKTKAKELGQELALLKGPATDAAALQFTQAIQGWVRQACQTHAQLAQQPWRAKTAQRKGRALRRQLRALCRAPLRYARAEAFRQRLMGPEQKHFFTCFRHRGVPTTNNQAERSLRPLVIMRKVIHGTRSNQGLENHSVLRSLLETARRQGKKPHQFFHDLFTKPAAQAQAALYRNNLAATPHPPRRC